MHKHVFPTIVGLNEAKTFLHVVEFHFARNHRNRPFAKSVQSYSKPSNRAVLRIVHRCLGGLFVRLAISEGETATRSGQMSIPRYRPTIDELTRLEATACLRDLIEEIRLVPDNGKLRIELYGELASLINLANGNPRSKEAGVQVTLVAGVGFEPTTFRL